eukprot:gnl/TRDRNA2_/TRDRNA2_72659_c0_seq1.p1 gnl/TRDRNA2_/TRDRNA2_72659_c0~~gnl/TRDRNA2_/TRDRNA2_72659_c0_seq1.p1  ORF type:complete len:231 (-),score=50.51 gnl/TRDRNA2_/TRDRNA2_72659_c0_seq1:77-733(-)
MWGDIADPLASRKPQYFVIILLFIALCFFAVLNVITGICVDSAIQSAQQDRDIVMERERKLNEQHVEYLIHLFGDADEDGSGLISKEEFVKCISDEKTQQALQALKIDVTYADTLFHIMDADQNGVIHLDEFVGICMKLKGEAKSVDIHTLIFENQKLANKVDKFAAQAHSKLVQICNYLKVEEASSFCPTEPNSPPNTLPPLEVWDESIQMPGHIPS